MIMQSRAIDLRIGRVLSRLFAQTRTSSNRFLKDSRGYYE